MPKCRMIIIIATILLSYTFQAGHCSVTGESLGEISFLEKRELINKRDAFTRVFENVYEAQVFDGDGNPTGEIKQIRRQIIEKASGLNYDTQDYSINPDGQPIWTPTDSNIRSSSKENIAYEVETGRVKVYFSNNLEDQYNFGYRVAGKTLKFGVVGVAYYDHASKERHLLQSPQSASPTVEENRLIYKEAFTGTDLEYVYEKSRFHTNLIIKRKDQFPHPANFGMDPASTYLVLIQRVDLDGYSRRVYSRGQEFLGTEAVEGADLKLEFRQDNGKVLHFLDVGTAWDAGSREERSETRVHKRLVKRDGNFFLLEGVPLTWLASADRKFPVVIDPVMVDTESIFTGREVWTRGNTYQVSDYFTVGGIGALYVEGGAVVKFGTPGVNGATGEIQITDNATFKSLGGPFNYSVFTSANDDSVGEALTGAVNPLPADYNNAILIDQASNQSVLEYMKIRYCFNGLVIKDTNLVNPIQNNIIADVGRTGIYLQCSSSGSPLENSVCNNLIHDIGDFGIEILAESEALTIGTEVYHNTFDKIGIKGVQGTFQGTITTNSPEIELMARNNLFSNIDGKAITFNKNLFEIDTVNSTIDHNGFYNINNVTDGLEDEDLFSPNIISWGDPPVSILGDNEYLNYYPYDIEHVAHGRHYLNKASGAGKMLRGAGESDLNIDIENKTVDAPMEITSDLQNAHWEKKSTDMDGTDIGYHHDRVDYIIGNNPTNYKINVTGTLQIEPGVVISYYRPLEETSNNVAELKVSGGDAKVLAEGLPGEYIRFDSVFATGQFISSPQTGPYSGVNNNYGKGLVLDAVSTGSRIRYCWVRCAKTGIEISDELDAGLSNNIFDYCGIGLKFYSDNHVFNNIFRKNFSDGLLAFNHFSQDVHTVENNIFDENRVGFRAGYMEDIPRFTTKVNLNNNIFQNQEDFGIRSDGVSEQFIVDSANNYFVNNATDTNSVYSTFGNDFQANPLIVSGSSSLIPSEYWDYMLQQNDGDYSRVPFKTGSLDSSEGISDVFSINSSLKLLVGASADVPIVDGTAFSTNALGKFSSGTYTHGSSSSVAPLWVAFHNDTGLTRSISSGARFTLKMGNDAASELVVYPPACQIPADSVLGLWVAQDGSTFWGNSVQSATGEASSAFDQDGEYSIIYTSGNLACSAAEGRVVADNSGNGNHGVLGAGTSANYPQIVKGKFGSGLQFDGENDVVDLSTIDTGGSFACELWVNPQSENGILLDRNLDGGRLQLINGQVTFSAKDSSGQTLYTATSSEAIALNTWTHIAALWDDGEISLYVNGKEQNGSSVAGNINSSSETVLGKNSQGGDYFKGILDEVRISNDGRDFVTLWQNGTYDISLLSDADTMGLWHLDASPAVNNSSDVDSFDYGSTASTLASDMQSPDAGYHYFNEKYFDDDGTGFQFTWDAPDDSVTTGNYIYYMKVVGHTGTPNPSQYADWTGVEEDAKLDFYPPLEDGEYIFTTMAVAEGDNPIQDNAQALANCMIYVDSLPPQDSYLTVKDSDEFVQGNLDTEGHLAEIVYGATANELIIEARFETEIYPWKVRFEPAFRNSSAFIDDTSPYQCLYRFDSGDNLTDEIEVVLYDGAGNSEVVQIPVTYHGIYHEELTPPTLFVKEPQPEGDSQDEWSGGSRNVTLLSLLTFSADDEDGSGVRDYSIHLQETGHLLGTSNEYIWNTGEVENGIYTLVYSATDWVGNSTSATRTAQVVSGPLHSVEITPSGAVIHAVTPAQSEIFSVNGYDFFGKTVDLSGGTVQWTCEAGSGNGLSYTFPAEEEGVYTLSVFAQLEDYDSIVRTAEDQVKVHVLGDNAVWYLDINPPKAISLSSGGSHQFSVTAKDWYNNVIENPAVEWSLSPQRGSITNTGLYTAPEEGIYDGETVTVLVESPINPEAYDSASVRFDLSPPLVYFVEPSASQELSGVSSAVSWFISDDAGYTYELTLDGKINLDESSTLLSGAQSYSTTWDTTMVVDGYHTLTVKATDEVGNSASASVTVIVNNAEDGTEAMIAAGLQWLLEHQKTAGYWDEQLDVSATGLALRAFTDLSVDVDVNSDRQFIASHLSELGSNASTSDLAYALIGGITDVTLLSELSSRQNASGWWDRPKGSGTADVECTALSHLALYYRNATSNATSAAYLESLLTNPRTNFSSDGALALTLFALHTSGDLQSTDTESLDGFTNLFDHQNVDGHWETFKDSSWAALAIAESGTYEETYTYMSAAENLKSFVGRAMEEEQDSSLSDLALAYWAVGESSNHFTGLVPTVNQVEQHLLARRVPANLVKQTDQGERGWHHFPEDFSESLIVANTLRVLQGGEDQPAVYCALLGSSTWSGFDNWLRSAGNAAAEDSLEHLARKLNSIQEQSSTFATQKYPERWDLLSRFLGLQAEPGYYPERVSLLERMANSLDHALAVDVLGTDMKESEQHFVDALSYLVSHRFEAEGQSEPFGWALSEQTIGQTPDVYTTALSLLILHELKEEGQVGGLSLWTALGKAEEWLAAQQVQVSATGSFRSNVVDTVLGYLALLDYRGEGFDRAGAQSFIQNGQEADGSWNGKPLDTALALLALHFESPPDLELGPGDVTGEVDGRNNAELTLKIENKSVHTLYSGPLQVALYDDDPDEEGSLAQRLGKFYTIPAATYEINTETNIGPIALTEFGYTPPAGTQTIFVKIDPQNRISEEDEFNNTSRINLALLTTVDLVADSENFLFNSSPYREKQSITLGGTIANRGEIVPTTPVAYRYTLGTPNGPELTASLDASPLDSKTYSLDTVSAVFSEGEFPFHLVVDPENLIEELEENNNADSRVLKVNPANGAFSCDLSLSDESIRFIPEAPRAGEFCTIVIKVPNRGEGVSRASDDQLVKLRISDNGVQMGGEDFLLNHTEGGIRPGGYGFLSVGWIFTPGVHDLRFEVDAGANPVLNDADRTNNVLEKSLYITPQDGGEVLNLGLTAEDINFSALPAVAGQSFVVSATVHNFGGKVADQDIAVEFTAFNSAGETIWTDTQSLTGGDLPIKAGDVALVQSSQRSLTEGIYEIQVAINGPYSNSAGAEETAGAVLDNTAVVRLPVTDSVDEAELVVSATSVFIANEISYVTEEQIIYGVVQNQGSASAQGAEVFLFDESTRSYLWNWGEFSLQADEFGVTQKKSYLAGGKHKLRLEVDGGQQVIEPDESNNEVEFQVEVQGTQLPDLTIEHNDFAAGQQNDLRLSMDPVDRSIILNALVHNRTSSDYAVDTVKDVKVAIYRNTDLLGIRTIDLLPSDGSVLVQWDTELSLSDLAGDSLVVWVDQNLSDSSAVEEASEENNSATLTVETVGAPQIDQVFVGDQTADITWLAPQGEGEIAGYQVYLDKAGDIRPSTLPVSTYGGITPNLEKRLTGLENLQKYYVGVTAVSISGLESAMDTAKLLPMAQPVISHVNGEEVSPDVAEFVNSSTVSVRVTASPHTKIKLYRNSTAISPVLLTDATGIASWESVNLETSTTTPVSNVFVAIAMDNAGEYFSSPSEPVNVVYDALVDLAIYSHDINLYSLDGTNLIGSNPEDFVGGTILIEARIRNLHGKDVDESMGNTVQFEYQDPNSTYHQFYTQNNVVVESYGETIVYATWEVPIDGAVSIRVNVDSEDNIVELTNENNSSEFGIEFEEANNFGQDFWFVYPKVYDQTDGELFVNVKDETSSCTLDFNGTTVEYQGSSNTIFTVTGPAIHKFIIPSELQVFGWNCSYDSMCGSVETKAIHLSSSLDIALMFYYPAEYAEDTFLILPENMLGEEYFVGNYTTAYNYVTEIPHAVLVVATENDTEINVFDYSGSEIGNSTIDVGEVFTFSNIFDDLTGSSVTSNKRVAVFCANPITWLPEYSSGSAKDTLLTTLLPNELLNTTYATAPYFLEGENKTSSIIRVVGPENTELIISDVSGSQYIQNGYYEFATEIPHLIEADQNVAVYQYLGSDSFSGFGDPNMDTVIPVSAFAEIDEITYYVPEMDFDLEWNRYLLSQSTTIFVNGEPGSSIEINGTIIPSIDWHQISNSNIKYATYTIESTTSSPPTLFNFTVENPNELPIYICAHGTGGYSSFSYPVALQHSEYNLFGNETGSPDLQITSNDINLMNEPRIGVPNFASILVHNYGTRSATEVVVEIYEETASGNNGPWYYHIEEIGSSSGQHRILHPYQVSEDVIALHAEVDPNDTIDESNETNNAASKSITLNDFALPDFKVDGEFPHYSIYLSDSSPDIGDTILVSAGIANTGEAYGGPVGVRFQSGGLDTSGAVSEATIPMIMPGEVRFATTEYLVTSHGLIDFNVNVDWYGGILESDETNNSSTKAILLTAPDLKFLSNPSVDVSPKVGEECQISINVKNGEAGYQGGHDGADIDENVEVAFYLGDPAEGGYEIGRDSINGISRSQEHQFTVSWTPEEAGTYSIYAVVDPDNTVGEFYAPAIPYDGEANNTAFANVEVGANIPDLIFNEPSSDIVFSATPGGASVDPTVGVTEGTKVDIAATVTSASYFSDWVKFRVFDGHPVEEASSQIGEDILLGHIPEDSTKTAQLTWDTSNQAGDNRLYFQIDEPGHLAAKAPASGDHPSESPLRIGNLAGNQILTVTDSIRYANAQPGIEMNLLSGTEVLDVTWSVEVWTANNLLPEEILGRWTYRPQVLPHGEYIDGATLSSAKEVLLKFSTEGESLPLFKEGQQLRLFVAGLDSATPAYELPVYIPDNLQGQYGKQLYLWVANDGSTYFANKYHLSGQYTNTEPLVFGALDATEGIQVSGISTPYANIYIVGSDAIPTDLSTVNKGSFILNDPILVYNQGSQDCYENTYLYLRAPGGASISEGAFIKLKTIGGEVLQIDLPQMWLDEFEYIAYWVNQTGGLYYAHSSHTPTGVEEIGNLFDQTFWEALSPADVVGESDRHLFSQGADTRLLGKPNLSATAALSDDRIGIVTESYELNNWQVVEFPVTTPSYPDFAVFADEIAMTINVVEVGQSLEVTALVHNLGADATQPLPVRFSLVDAETGSIVRSIPNGEKWLWRGLRGGASAAVSVVFSPTVAGSYNLVVDIDPDELFLEGSGSAEGLYANSAQKLLTINVSEVDFQVATLGIEGATLVPKSTFEVGERVYFEWFVENQGSSGFASYQLGEGGVWDTAGNLYESLSDLDYLMAYQIPAGATFTDTSLSWISHTAGTYSVRGALFDSEDSEGGAIANASASFVVTTPPEEVKSLYVVVEADKQLYSISNPQETISLTQFFQNQSAQSSIGPVTSILSISFAGSTIWSTENTAIAELDAQEYVEKIEDITVNDLISFSTNPIGLYEVVLSASANGEVPPVTAESKTWFTIEADPYSAILNIANASGVVEEIIAATDILVQSSIEGSPVFDSDDWMILSKRPLSSWYGGGKNLLFNPGQDFDSDGDGTANGWTASVGTEATAAYVENNRVQQIQGANPQLSLDSEHLAFVERNASYALSFDYRISSASGALEVWIEEYDGQDTLIRKLGYIGKESGIATLSESSLWNESEWSHVEIGLLSTSTFSNRLNVVFAGETGSGTPTIQIDQVQLERGTVATSWIDSEPNNLLLNGGFEQGDLPLDYSEIVPGIETSPDFVEGWFVDQDNYTYLLDSGVVYSGSYSLKITEAIPASTALQQRYLEIIPGATYTLSLWSRKDDSASYYVEMEEFDSSFSSIASATVDITPITDDLWFSQSNSFTTETNAAYLSLAIKGGQSGSLWLDNLQLEHGELATEWIGPVAYQNGVEWTIAEPYGTKAAHGRFQNTYGQFITDPAAQIALDENEDGTFDVLGETGEYHLEIVTATGNIIVAASESMLSNVFDGNGESAFLESRAGDRYDLILDLGATYLMDRITTVVTAPAQGNVELEYSWDGINWLSAVTLSSTKEAGVRGFEQVTFESVLTEDFAPLKQRYFRIKFPPDASSQIELADLKINGYPRSSIDTMLYPPFKFEGSTFCIFDATELASLAVGEMVFAVSSTQGFENNYFETGSPTPGSQPNSLEVLGDNAFSIQEGVFTVAQLNYYNGETYSDTSLLNPPAHFFFNFVNPSGIGIREFVYNFELTLTPNQGGPVADELRITGLPATQFFEARDKIYGLDLLGFSETQAVDDIQDIFVLDEYSLSTSFLMAQLTQIPHYPPKLYITAPTEGELISSPIVVVTATVEATNLTHVLIDGVTATLSQNGNIYQATAQITIPTIQDYTIVAQAFDDTPYSDTDSVRVYADTVTNIQIASPEPNHATGVSTIIVSATGVEPNLATVQIADSTTSPLVEGDNYSATAEVALSAGWNIIPATVEDLAGNIGTASISVYYDQFVPAPQFNELFLAEYSNQLTVAVQLGATDDVSSSSEIEFRLTGDISPDFTWRSLSLAPASVTLSPVTDDIKRATLSYRDSFGNQSSYILDQIVLDTTTEIWIIAPEAESATSASAIIVTATGVEQNPASITIADTTTTVSWETDVFTATAEVQLSAGWNIATATVEDLAGNIASTTGRFFYDIEPPVPVLSEIFDDSQFVDNYWDNLLVDLVLGATDNFTPQSMIEFILVGDVTPEYASYIPLASAPLTITLDPSSDGLKSATAQYRDQAKNVSTYVYDELTIDRSAPAVALLQPASGSYKSGNIIIEATGFEDGVGLASHPTEFRFTDLEPSEWSNLNTLADYGSLQIAGTLTASATLDTETRPDGDNLLQVRVLDRLGNFETDESLFTIDNSIPPPAPLNLVAVADATDTIHLTWEINTQNDIGGYKVYRSTSSGTGYSFIADAGLDLNYEDVHSATNFISGTTQYYVVKAYDLVNNLSKVSNEANANLQYPSTPSAPLHLEAYSGDSFVNLYWKSDLNPNLVAYRIYRKTTGSYQQIASNIQCSTTNASYHDDGNGVGLINGTCYYYYVKSYYLDNPTHESERSNEVIGCPTAVVNKSYRLSIGMEDLKNQNRVDWDFNDMTLVVDATETLAAPNPDSGINDVNLYLEITQREAGDNKYVYVDLEVDSGTATVRIDRSHSISSYFTPSSATYEISSPFATTLLLYGNDEDYDVGKNATLSIVSKSQNFELSQWHCWYENRNTGEKIYPTKYKPLDNSQEVEDEDSPFYGRWLDFVIIIENSEEPITFSDEDEEAIWDYYPKYVDFILSSEEQNSYWYRN